MKEIEKNTNPCSVDSNKYTLELINGWINNADTKISIACGLSSVVLAAIAFGADIIWGRLIETRDLNTHMISCFVLFVVVAIVTFIVSLWYYFWALNPSLTSGKSIIEKPKYSIFYKDISLFANVDDYIECVKLATEDDFKQELICEIYINSGICTKKMQRFKTGMWLSVVSIFSAVVSCVFLCMAVVV